ncbi:AsnC family transcriptional regulator [Mycolicibacterium canariasense]|uniref:AsnC family transcriptional regulator n=1 Tax=Mycolicibacterium canariasense TaxID=228230 RepID=A0A124E1S0_MYCCR|nr:AsnC family transcriptional regulator [Mycolicibacterium canariasense]MCV7208681.1 AsnC family transcriptional regulator [Mycolicibacterium canariasense]ORV07240.1 AsnC family transcriptional regulator [Mycolicibacterium canariasense]GAS94533.1 AsnC family transcriptional regulator [Mycolicibacterium canariasense]
MEVLDGHILHALQIAPRAPFRRIAEVIGAGEHTVARRYRALRRGGVLRVIGVVNPRVYGECQWIVRVHAKPDNVPKLAEALVRWPEVTHANVLSGGTELICVVRAPIGDTGDGLLHRLPRTSAVLDVRVDLVLNVFGQTSSAHWTGYGRPLSAEQIAALQPAASARPNRPGTPSPDDQRLIDALADDGRISDSALAALTGWSPARVKRRLAALQDSDTLSYDLDVLPELLGYRLNATIWIATSPRHLTVVAEQIVAHDEVASVVAVSGSANLMAVVICRDVEHLYRYLAERLATVEHIQTYDVGIRSKRLKQVGSLIAHGRLIGAS